MRKAIAAGHTNLDLAEMQERWPPVEHPVVVTHPETGRQGAVREPQLDDATSSALTERENDVLLPFLLDHVRSPEFQCRFHWEPDSIAFWDNRCVQHYAVADYVERRVCTVSRRRAAGPVSVTGRRGAGTSPSRARSASSPA